MNTFKYGERYFGGDIPIGQVIRESTPEYTVCVDMGKPYEEKIKGKDKLKECLLSLKEVARSEDPPCCDVWILSNNREVTDEMFKELKIVTD